MIKKKEKSCVVIRNGDHTKNGVSDSWDHLSYVSNELICLFLLGILPMDMEVDILHNNNMLQDLLQICKFI
jgi:hypothetical protein